MAEKIVKDSQGLAKELVNGVKEFEELKVIDLNGRPYYSIIYLENGNEFEGYASYNLKVISEYLKRHFGFAQPETHDKRTETHTCDLISRQAAIELIERMKPYHQDADDIAEMIANMPSAQPTIIQCKDCKHNPKESWFGCPMSHLSEKQRPGTAWCWKGERKDDE